MKNWKQSSKMMAGMLGITLSWFVLSADLCNPCHEPTKEEKYPFTWVACVDNKPVLFRYFNDVAVPLGSQGLNAKDWDCTKGSSPKWIGSGAPSSSAGSSSGPYSVTNKTRAATFSQRFLAPPVLPLPFTPKPDGPPGNPPCDSSYADVIHVNHLQSTVSLIGGCTFAVKGNVTVTDLPLQVATTRDGRFALVTSFDGALTAIDLATFRIAYTIRTDGNITPNGLAILPDDTRAYITNFDTDGAVQAIDLATRRVVTTIRTSGYPSGAVLTPDGSQLWLTFPFSGGVWVIDTLTNTVVTQLSTPPSTGLAFDSRGTRAYVTVARGQGQVLEIDAQTYQPLRTFNVGTGPGDIAMSYHDEYLIVNNHEGNSISIINLIRETVKTMNVGREPMGIIPVSLR
jgi:YVTN family beta-propeller protein